MCACIHVSPLFLSAYVWVPQKTPRNRMNIFFDNSIIRFSCHVSRLLCVCVYGFSRQPYFAGWFALLWRMYACVFVWLWVCIDLLYSAIHTYTIYILLDFILSILEYARYAPNTQHHRDIDFVSAAAAADYNRMGILLDWHISLSLLRL